MEPKEQPLYTLADLLTDLQSLTLDQLAKPAEFWGEHKTGSITGLFVAEEDYVNPSGEAAEPASSYRPKPGEAFDEMLHLTEEEISLECVLRAGAVKIEVD